MTIIRDQNALQSASDADLTETYLALTGKKSVTFKSRAEAEAKTSMAILAAQNDAGHAGVAKGQKPAALTPEERAAKKVVAAEARAAKKAAAPAKRGRAAEYTHVIPLDTGDSKLRPRGTRSEVYAAIVKLHSETGAPVKVEDLEPKDTARAYVSKLMKHGHVAPANVPA